MHAFVYVKIKKGWLIWMSKWRSHSRIKEVHSPSNRRQETLTFPGPGEELDAGRRGAGRRAEHTTEAQPAGGLGWGALLLLLLLRGVGEDALRGARADLGQDRGWCRAWGRADAGAPQEDALGRAGGAVGQLPLGRSRGEEVWAPEDWNGSWFPDPPVRLGWLVKGSFTDLWSRIRTYR